MNILLVVGGKSVEEGISVLTGLSVFRALKSGNKFSPLLVYYDQYSDAFYGGEGVTRLENYDLKKGFKKIRFYKDKENYFKIGFKKYYFDLVLPLVHGENAEDGTMAAFFSILGYPTLSSPIQASAISQDKVMFKRLLNSLKIKTPRFIYLDIKDYQKDAINLGKYLKSFSFPLIIKPYNLGSSIGINIAHTIEEFYSYLDIAFLYSDRVIIEEYIKDSREVNIALINSIDGIIYSEFEEIIKNNDSIYSFDEKYLNQNTKKIIPSLENSVKDKIKEMAKKVYLELGLCGVVRFDFLIKDDICYLNEVNTIPGNYASNLFAHVGLSVNDLISIYIAESKDRIKKNLIPRKEKASFEAFEKSNKLKLN